MSAIEANKPVRILVIQFARLGDSLQSLMALRAAKQLYPSLEIHYVARDKFCSAAQRVPWIHRVIPFPTDQMIGPAMSGRPTGEGESLRELARWVSPLVQERWDLVLNWSYSEPSSFLAALLPAKIKLGFTRRKDLGFMSADGWSHYIQAIVQGGVGQNIHLTDILTTQLLTALQIHLGEPANEGDSPVTSKSFFSLKVQEPDLKWLGADSARRLIAIQVGTGRESRNWAPAHWARFCQLILSRHPDTRIVLLGSKEDSGRAARIQAEVASALPGHRGVLNLAGRTDFDTWAAIVAKCQWLVAGDCSAVHLASVLGTRVLKVATHADRAPARFAETGPYGNGHYLVSPHPESEEGVSPEALYSTWSYASSEWSHRRQVALEVHYSQLGWSRHLEHVQVYRSKVRPSSDGGGVHYEPLVQRSLTLDEWSSMVMGHIARAWYCGWVPPVGQELKREMISPVLIQKLRELQESSAVLHKVAQEAGRTAGQLNQKSSKLRSDKIMGIRSREELTELGRKLSELDGLIERLGRTHSPLAAFSRMSQVLMHNLKSDQLTDLGRESAECYQQLHEGVVILGNWLKHTLGLARPVAVPLRPDAEVTTLHRPPGPGTPGSTH